MATAAMGRRPVLTVGIARGNRDMGLRLVLPPADPVCDVSLFFALTRLPIYLLPAVLGSAHRWWLARA